MRRIVRERGQPVEYVGAPRGAVDAVGVESSAVAAAGVNTQRASFYAVAFEGFVEECAVDGRHGAVVVGEQQQRGWRGCRHAILQRPLGLGFGRAFGAQQMVERSLVAFVRFGSNDGVDQYGKGRTYRFGKHRGGRSGQMSARRESHDAYARGIDAVLLGVVAEVAQRRFGVFERHLAATVGQAVFERNGRDAVRGQPLAHFVPFALHRDEAIAAARADDDALSGRLVARGGVDEEFGVDGVVDSPFFLCLGTCGAVGVGCRGVVPQFDHFDLSRGGQCGREGEQG